MPSGCSPGRRSRKRSPRRNEGCASSAVCRRRWLRSCGPRIGWALIDGAGGGRSILPPMSEQSAKPYLVRAICEWCADNGLTPYLAVKVDSRTRVPTAYVKNGEIVLNISAAATRRLTIDNDWVQFNARFAGVSQEVSVPMSAVTGVFAKETGYGFAFSPALVQDP